MSKVFFTCQEPTLTPTKNVSSKTMKRQAPQNQTGILLCKVYRSVTSIPLYKVHDKQF